MKADYPHFKSLYFHEELTEHFSLAVTEHRFLRRCRGKANRLTAALMLKSLGYLGYFPKSTRHIPIPIGFTSRFGVPRTGTIRLARHFNRLH